MAVLNICIREMSQNENCNQENDAQILFTVLIFLEGK